MTTPSPLSEKNKAANHEHIDWLEDYSRWRSDHRQALAMLAKVAASVLEQEAALESHMAHVRLHEMHLQKYKLAEYVDGTPDYEQLEEEHSDWKQKHDLARQVHKRISKHHVNIADDVEKLLRLCESGM